jgi:hypothetical protein
VHKCVAPFTNHGKMHEFGGEKPISWAKPAHFDFFTLNCTVWSHILSTGGDALTVHLRKLWIHITMEGTFTYCKANTPTKSKECTSPTLSKHYHWSQMISHMIQKIAHLHFKRFLVPSSFRPPIKFFFLILKLKNLETTLAITRLMPHPNQLLKMCYIF